jgi:hypothetical protein
MASGFHLSSPSRSGHRLPRSGTEFKRKDLLKFDPRKPDPRALCFEFKRTDTGRSVLVKFHPHQIPFSEEKGRRMGELLEKVIWEAAREGERREFQELWTEKVKDMILEEKDIDRWLTIEVRRNST